MNTVKNNEDLRKCLKKKLYQEIILALGKLGYENTSVNNFLLSI